MPKPVHHLAETFAVLKPDLSVEPVAVSPTIYADLDTRFNQFKGHVLISEYDFATDWPVWERHPAGDETVVLLSGRVNMVLRRDGNEEIQPLNNPGDYAIVPAGVWHTARTSVATRMLFITPGESTEHTPIDIDAAG